MKISLVTGCYNHQETLPLLLKSLVPQNIFLHEWIICDDGSNNATKAILREYEKLDKVKVVEQENKGMRLAKSLNNGFKQVTGDLIFVVMGDTYLEKDTLRKIQDTYVRGTAGSGLRKNVYDNGDLHSWDWRFPDGRGEKIYLTGPRKFSQLTGNSMLVMREHLKEIGYWDERYEGYGRDDWCAFLRLDRLGVPLIAYNNIVVNHVWHGEGGEDNPENVKLFMEELNKINGKDKERLKQYADRS